MSAVQAIVAICGAIGALGLGAGVRWAISGLFSVIRDAINEMQALRLEIREMRVEVRTALGIAPPPDDDHARERELTPVRGVGIGSYSFVRKRTGNQGGG